MIIEYYTKNVYGKENHYIAKPELAANWKFISGRKTITLNDMDALRNMGITHFQEVIQPK